MSESEVAIVIPLYKSNPSKLEEISIKQCFSMLSGYQIIAVVPEGFDLSAYPYSFHQVIPFDPLYFANIAGYNRLMLSAEFYQQFLSYNYILIYQLDALVFSDQLSYWCNLGYDYIGAPWLREAAYPDLVKKIKNNLLRKIHTHFNFKDPKTGLPTSIQFENQVGNGGLSLRRTKLFHQICMQKTELISIYNSKDDDAHNEDSFWSIGVNRNTKLLNIPHFKTAVKFSIENNCQFAFELTGKQLPFGCHAWDKNLNFWTPYLIREGLLK